MVRAARSATTLRNHDIVGRAEQRAQLGRILDEVIDDGSRFVIMGGDAGAGKTTVVEVFVADLFGPLADRKAQVIRGQCVPMGGEGLPYAPIVGALRDLVTQHGREQILEWAGAGREALGALLPDLGMAPREDDDTIRLRLYEVVTMLLERASENGPLVVIMEDIHWADESTRHLLRFLARALTEASVMIITTYRSDELTRRHPLRPFLADVGRFPGTVRIDLPNLERAEVAELLTQLMERPPSNVVIDLVYKRSEGIPYFVEELTRSAARGCIDMPDTLRDALNVRVLSLSERTQQTLQLAAVAGNRVDHELLAAAAAEASDGELENHLREAIDAAVLTTDETGYSFRHALLREVVHDDLLPGQHARLHARFARLLEEHPELMSAGAVPPEIAHHWNAAHEVNKAFRWALTAAESGSAAFHESLKLYERALELWDQVDDPESVAGPHAGLLMRAAHAAEDAGEFERALALVNGALEELDPDKNPRERIEALIVQAHTKFGVMASGGVEALQEAVRILPEDADAALRARVLEMLARRTMLSGDPERGLEFSQQAVDAAALADSDSITMNAWITLGTSLAAAGHEDEGLAAFERVSHLAGSSTRTLLRFYINYSDALNHVGRYEDAASQAMSGVEMARELGLQRSVGAMLAGNAAEPLLALGQWARASAMIERALELDPPANHHAHLRLLQAWLHVWRGQLDEADAVLIEFRPLISGEQLDPQYSSQAIRTDAEHALAVGDHQRAWSDVGAFLDHWELYERTQCYPVLAAGAAAARVLDQREGTGERLALVRDHFDHRAMPVRIRPIWEPVIIAELQDTAEAWRFALDQLAKLSAPAHLHPYAGLRLGQHLVAGRERTEAKQVLATASEEAAAIGSALLADRINALSQRAGFVVAPPADESPLGGLTPREIEVLQLVAAGKSNGDIGHALFISTKTASVHVSNILAKLGVTSRGEAAAVAHRIGLTSL
jgi:DNA-binding CsgD family transcriptional regulator/tetratricopeptide (TPR) repeat protein